mgnify:CR=1 FL=1
MAAAIAAAVAIEIQLHGKITLIVMVVQTWLMELSINIVSSN